MAAMDLYFLRLLSLDFLLSLPGERKPHVTVLGAGISGLSSAKVLKQFTSNLSVLEARSRIGGRIHTIAHPYIDDLKLDLGASWIHGIGPGTIDKDLKWRN